MSLKTRLDGRSPKNDSFDIVHTETEEVLATIKLNDEKSANLTIESKEGLHIAKPNGWTSKK